MSIVVGGTRIVSTTPAKSRLLPLNFSRANAYPATALEAAVSSVVVPASANVFASVSQ